LRARNNKKHIPPGRYMSSSAFVFAGGKNICDQQFLFSRWDLLLFPSKVWFWLCSSDRSRPHVHTPWHAARAGDVGPRYVPSIRGFLYPRKSLVDPPKSTRREFGGLDEKSGVLSACWLNGRPSRLWRIAGKGEHGALKPAGFQSFVMERRMAGGGYVEVLETTARCWGAPGINPGCDRPPLL